MLLHLALGDSAAGCLRGACQSDGLPGIVVAIADDLSHGPLDSGQRRSDYMRALYQGYDHWNLDSTDAFVPWAALVEQLGRQEPEAVVIWSGENVSERTFLAMACWWLRDRPETIRWVPIPDDEGPPYVAIYAPAHLAALYPINQLLCDVERAMLRDDFERIRFETGLVRRLEQGRVIGISPDYYDQQLMDACTSDWTPAARIVGAAMGQCDPHHLMSDLFFASRLRVLIERGDLQVYGQQERLRDYSVRRARS